MKVLNFGSLNIDYVYDVEHFVKKGETISSSALNVFPGGKGLNQSIALAKAGAEVYHAGMIGEDGKFLAELLAEAGVNTDNILISKEVRTGNAIIQNDSSGDNCIILFGGANRAINRSYIDKVLEKFGEGDYIILQNEISELPYIISEADKKGMKIVLNPSPMDDIILKEADLSIVSCFLLNEVEAKALLCNNESEPEKLMELIVGKFPKAGVLITLGGDGSIYGKDKKIIKEAAVKTDVRDTTAAGDTFTGFFVTGLLSGEDMGEVLKRASMAASIAVSRKGAAISIPTLKEVEERLAV